MIAGSSKILAVQNPDEQKNITILIDFMNFIFDCELHLNGNFSINRARNSNHYPVCEMFGDCMAVLEVRRYVVPL